MCRSYHHHSRGNWDWADEADANATRAAARDAVQDPITTPGDLRVSDAERHAVIDLLRRHVGDDRVTLAEFESRLDDVMAASPGDDLRAVLRDLPPLPPPPDPAAERRKRTQRRPERLASFTPILM